MYRSLTVSLAACAALVAAAAVPSPALAGIQYTAVTSTEGPGQSQRTAVEAWIDGPRGKVVFSESGSPGLEAGQYLLTQDGGKTLYLVDPKEKAYAEWDLEAMLQMFGSLLQAMGPIVNFKIENVEVEKLGSESGGTVAGLPTTKTRWRTEYDLTLKVLGMGRKNHVETFQEVWSTGELADPALGLWLRAASPTGFEELDELVSAEAAKLDGFPLKSIAVTTTTGQKGKRSQESRVTTEVTSLDRSVAIPASTFEIPEGYTQSQALVPQTAQGPEGEEEEEEEEEGNPFRRILGGG